MSLPAVGSQEGSGHRPVPGQRAHLGVVLDLGLGAAGAQRGHAAVLEGERDHLAALAHRQHLQDNSRPSVPLEAQPLGAEELQQHQAQ